MSLTQRVTLWTVAALVFGLLATTGTAQAQPKFAVISTQEIIQGSQAGKKAIEQVRALQQQKEDEVKAKQQEITDLRNRLNEGRLSLAEDKLQELQDQLETAAKKLRRMQEDAAAELKKRQEEVLSGIEREVMPIIQKVGQEDGYTMIFRKFDSGLVYVDETVDITQQVIERLDQKMASAAGDSSQGE
jgi:outer membrane protein